MKNKEETRCKEFLNSLGNGKTLQQYELENFLIDLDEKAQELNHKEIEDE